MKIKFLSSVICLAILLLCFIKPFESAPFIHYLRLGKNGKQYKVTMDNMMKLIGRLKAEPASLHYAHDIADKLFETVDRQMYKNCQKCFEVTNFVFNFNFRIN